MKTLSTIKVFVAKKLWLAWIEGDLRWAERKQVDKNARPQTEHKLFGNELWQEVQQIITRHEPSISMRPSEQQNTLGWSEPVNVCLKSATEFRRRVILQPLQTGRVTLTTFHRFALPGIAGPCCHNDGQCTIENSIGQPHSQLDWRLYFVSRCAVEQWAWLQREDWQWHSHSAVISCQ